MDIYSIVTERIINLLESGVVPFFLLSASKYVSPFWLTMRQLNESRQTVEIRFCLVIAIR
jgi:antirestriction protein ArdC